MRKSISSFFLASVLVFGSLGQSLPAFAQRRAITAKPGPTSLAVQRGVETISVAQLRDYLSFIASDEMEGRDTPSRGLDTTARFLATNLARWGFKPAGDDGTFLQKIALSRDLIDKSGTHAEFNGEPLVLGEDYIPSRVRQTSPARHSCSRVMAGL